MVIVILVPVLVRVLVMTMHGTILVSIMHAHAMIKSET